MSGEGDAVAVVGLWHLGSVAAAAWSTCGRRVLGWDPDSQLRSAIARASGPVSEPGLDTALRLALDGGILSIVDDPATAIAGASLVHLTYDTQVDGAGNVADPRFDHALSTFADAAPDGALLLVSSQV